MPHTSLFGKWIYSFPFYYSELIIDKDGTFKFYSGSCTGHGYTEGKWANNGDDLVFTSFDKFKYEIKPTLVEFKSEPNKVSKKAKTKSDKEFIDRPDMIIPDFTVTFKYPDTSNVYFDKVKFKLRGDTLYKLDSNELLTNSKYTIAKNNR